MCVTAVLRAFTPLRNVLSEHCAEHGLCPKTCLGERDEDSGRKIERWVEQSNCEMVLTMRTHQKCKS